MMRLDQSQYQRGSAAGFGQTAAIRYRGMGFIPSLPVLRAITFLRNKGSQGIKIYIDTADSNSIPTNAPGSELYSFTVTNAQIVSGAFQRFVLPKPLAVTPGNQYAFYIAPWNTSTDAYADDYADMQWKNSNVYASGKPIVWDAAGAGTFVVSDAGNLDAYFETWGSLADEGFKTNIIRPRAFAPGLAR